VTERADGAAAGTAAAGAAGVGGGAGATAAGGVGAGTLSRERPVGARHTDRSPHGSETGRAAGWRDRFEAWQLAEILVAWLVARVVVGAALGLTRFVSNEVSDGGGQLDRTGLLGWDAGWYRTIAEGGYASAGDESRRFFPLLPLLVRGLAALPGLGGHEGLLLVALVNVVAVGFAVAVVRVAAVEGFDETARVRLIWLTALAPPAFVLVMGYAEALAGLLAALALLGARTRRWELAAVAGLLGGLCRPLGLLLLVPVAIEAARGLRELPGREVARRVAAVLAPVVGCGIYLAWSSAKYGDGLAPLTMQRDAARHGSTANPLDVVLDAVRGTFHGELGTGLHVPWLVLAAVGLVVMARRLPASYAVWSGLVFAAVLTGSNLDSSERYLYGAFPFLLVAALVTGRRLVWPGVLVVSAAAMTVYATLAFLLLYVP
jgi:hypothetical protein